MVTPLTFRSNPSFTIQEGYGQIREYVIDHTPLIIGRDVDCDVIVEDSNVSRHHARLTRDGASLVLEDLNSANGLFVNSMPATVQPLKHMDIIQLGGAMIILNDPDNSASNSGTEMPSDESPEPISFNFDFLTSVISKLEENIGIVFKGKPEVVKNMIVCLLADGHLLLEDVPGVGKSILAQTLAKSIQAKYRRIQFTPDMLPSDITGMSIYDDKTQSFRFIPGPIFGNVILADEINRTTPRTQASLLECMSESVVTIDGKGHILPKPFFVIATQNPEDYHGTYPLPEPQLDRFLMRLSIGYPTHDAERDILDSQATRHPLSAISYVIKGTDIVHCQALVRRIKVSAAVKDYIIDVSNMTRTHPALACGCSPRASLALMKAGQALAAYYGRTYVTPYDIREILNVTVSHRLRLKLRHQAEWKSVGNVLDAIVKALPLKNEEFYQ